MLLKILVLVGLAIYFFIAGELGLSFLALAAIIPNVGLFLAVILVIVLLVRTWYGSAAILIGLIAFNLIGNSILEKRVAPSPDIPNEKEEHES